MSLKGRSKSDFKKFFGWEQATINQYRDCYTTYGGNFSTHPDVLNYFHHHADCQEKFYVHQTRGEIDGAACAWNDKYLANDITTDEIVSHFDLPVAKDELILPVTRQRKIVVPFKSKIISPVNANIINRIEKINARRTICLAKPLDKFSKRTRDKRKQEVNKFIRRDRVIKDQSEFTPEEIVSIYDLLFEKRRGIGVKNKQAMIDFCHNFRSNFFGKILFYKEQPCAFHLIIKSESRDILSFDFINISRDINIKELSLGTILMWLNLKEASNISKMENKQLRFSYGRPTFDYKSMWCFQQKLGKLL